MWLADVPDRSADIKSTDKKIKKSKSSLSSMAVLTRSSSSPRTPRTRSSTQTSPTASSSRASASSACKISISTTAARLDAAREAAHVARLQATQATRQLRLEERHALAYPMTATLNIVGPLSYKRREVQARIRSRLAFLSPRRRFKGKQLALNHEGHNLGAPILNTGAHSRDDTVAGAWVQPVSILDICFFIHWLTSVLNYSAMAVIYPVVMAGSTRLLHLSMLRDWRTQSSAC